MNRKKVNLMLPGLGLVGLAAFGWIKWSGAHQPTIGVVPQSVVEHSGQPTLSSGVNDSITSPEVGAIDPEAGMSVDQNAALDQVANSDTSATVSRLGEISTGRILDAHKHQLVGGAFATGTETGQDPLSDEGNIDGLTPSGVRPENVMPSAPIVLVPMAALNPTPAMPTGEAPQAALAGLQAGFEAALTGPVTDAAPPAPDEVIQRWQLAQPASDQMFRVEFGWQAYMQQQLQQHLASAAAANLAQQSVPSAESSSP